MQLLTHSTAAPVRIAPSCCRLEWSGGREKGRAEAPPAPPAPAVLSSAQFPLSRPCAGTDQGVSQALAVGAVSSPTKAGGKCFSCSVCRFLSHNRISQLLPRTFEDLNRLEWL